MSKVFDRVRQPLLSALAVAVVGQVLFTSCGDGLPDRSDSYGAPFSVGQATGWNVLFTAGMGSFRLPEWILNVLVTAATLLVSAIVLRGRTISGVIAASLAVLTAYVTYLVVAELQLSGADYNTNQLAIWVWMLLVVTAVWGVNDFRQRRLEARHRTDGAL